MKLNTFILMFALNALGAPLFAGESSFDLEKSVFKTSEMEFKEHVSEEYWGNYLSMRVPLPPIAELFKKILVRNGGQLTSRGEAHITVITPIEYNDFLKEHIKIDEINKIARELKIQSSRFEVDCLGWGKKKFDPEKNDLNFTYFVVVKSADLIAIRKEIAKRFWARGGNEKEFHPRENFYPHITVGFTSKDLHFDDGVVKDREHSFYRELNIVKPLKR